MDTEDTGRDRIAVTDFKARCLAICDGVATGKTGPVVLTKRNRPLVAIVPIGDGLPDLWGALRGSVSIAADTDLTAPMGEAWDADA